MTEALYHAGLMITFLVVWAAIFIGMSRWWEDN